MKTIKIIEKYYKPDSKSYKILLNHSRSIQKKALEIAKKFPEADLDFISEASLLHDIGIYQTNAPEINCHGNQPYICHGILGQGILEKENLPRHALVCARHIGTGLSKKYIREKKLPLPEIDMLPKTLEEEIITYTDKFFSKSKENISKEKNFKQIIKELNKYSQEDVKRFQAWHKKFK